MTGPCITLHNGAPWDRTQLSRTCASTAVGEALAWPRGPGVMLARLGMDRNWIQQKNSTNWVFSEAGGGGSDGASCAAGPES